MSFLLKWMDLEIVLLSESEKKVKVAQSCPTLSNPKNYTVHGILYARMLEWVAVLFSRGFSQPRERTQVSHTADGLYQLSHQGSPKKTQGKRQISYDIAHMCNLKKRVQMPLSTNRNSYRCRKLTYDDQGISRGGIKWKSVIDIYILLHVKQITNKDLLYSTGNCTQYLVITYNEKRI